MKRDSLTELQEASRILNYTVTDMSNAKEDIENALKHLRAALFMETPAPSGKFDLYEIANDDNGTRPILGCVHHQDGFKTASDGKVLVSLKADYAEDMEGKNIDKKGEALDLNFPRYQALFTDKQKKAKGWHIDFDKVAAWKKELNTEKKMKGKRSARRAIVKVGNAYFDLECLFKFAKFMKEAGTDTLRIEDSRRAAASFSEDGSRGLIMPMAFVSVDYKDENLDALWETKDTRVMMWAM